MSLLVNVLWTIYLYQSILTLNHFVNVPIRFRKKTFIYKTINVVKHVHDVGVYDIFKERKQMYIKYV